MPSDCRALSEPRPLTEPQCPCLWNGCDDADRVGWLWADRGGRLFIPSGLSGNEERDTTVRVPTHLLMQPHDTGGLSAHSVPGEDRDEHTRQGPSAPLTTRGDRGPQEARRNVWRKQWAEGSGEKGCQCGLTRPAAHWGHGAGTQTPGSDSVSVPP